MLNLKSKHAILGIAATAAVLALTVAGLAVQTTAGAGTDAGTDTAPRPVVTATPTTGPAATPTAVASTPPQAPVEPPAAIATDPNAGGQAGADTLPSAGTGDAVSHGNGTLFFLLAGTILATGIAMTVAGRMPSRKQ